MVGSPALSYIKSLGLKASDRTLCQVLISIDIATIFTLYFLKKEEAYAQIILTLIQDLVKEDYFITEPIITLLAFQRVFDAMIDLNKLLSPQESNIGTVIECYKQLREKNINANNAVFECMIQSLVKDIYPSQEAALRAGSWKKYSLRLSDAILHIQLINRELSINMKIIRLFMFWRGLIEIYLSAGYTDEQIYEEVEPLIGIHRQSQADDYHYHEGAVPLCCEILDNLFKNLNSDKINRMFFLELFSRYLVDSYETNRDNSFKLCIIKEALGYKYLIPHLSGFLEEVLYDAGIEFSHKELLIIDDQEVLEILDEKLIAAGKNSELSVQIDFILHKFHIAEYFERIREEKEENEQISQSYLENLWKNLRHTRKKR